jgi:protein-disulfide isomerase
MRKFSLLTAAAFVVSLCGQEPGPKGPDSALDKPTLEQYVRHMFAWGPQIQLKIGDPEPSASLPGFREVTVTATAGQASQAMTFYVTADGRRFIQGSVYDITVSPFQADLAKIRTDLEPSFGAPGAPVVIVVFSDFQCGFCKEEGKLLRDNVAKQYPDQVRVYFKDYPLEAIHPWAKPAAIAGRCIFRQKPAAFWDYHDWIFGAQNEVTPENLRTKVEEFAKSKSLEPVQLGACIDNKTTVAEVDRSIAEGKALAVNSTPTMFINGRRVVGQVPWPQLKQVIDHELEYAKTHGGGEKCCEVKVPGVKP